MNPDQWTKDVLKIYWQLCRMYVNNLTTDACAWETVLLAKFSKSGCSSHGATCTHLMAEYFNTNSVVSAILWFNPSLLRSLRWTYPLAQNQYMKNSPRIFSCTRPGVNTCAACICTEINSPKNFYVLAPGMCGYRHYINTEGKGQSANTYLKNNSLKLFPVFAHKVIPQECFVPGGTVLWQPPCLHCFPCTGEWTIFGYFLSIAFLPLQGDHYLIVFDIIILNNFITPSPFWRLFFSGRRWPLSNAKPFAVASELIRRGEVAASCLRLGG